MIKLNNKGQSLVLFIIFIPILLGIMALVIDLGNAISKKAEIDSVLELVLDYGVDSGEVFLENEEPEYLNEKLINWKDDLKLLLNYNLNDINSEVIIQNNKLIISSNYYIEGIFSNILNIKGFKIESEYIGYIENNEKKIEKIK